MPDLTVLLKFINIALLMSINLDCVCCNDGKVSAKTENVVSFIESSNFPNEDKMQLENNETVFQSKLENEIYYVNIRNESVAYNEVGIQPSLAVSEVSEAENMTMKQNEEGRAKKKKDKFDKVVMKVDKGRVLKLDGSFMLPTLMGVLLKVTMAIPVILAIATVVGTISLIGSKFSLLISAVLGVRTLIQYYRQLYPATPEPPPITQSDMMDIQNMISKQNQINDASLIPMAMPSPPPSPTIPPMKPIPLSMADLDNKLSMAQTPAPADSPNTKPSTEKPYDPYEDTALKPASFDDLEYFGIGHSGVDHLGFGHSGIGHPGYGHFGIGHPGYDHAGIGHPGFDHSAAGHLGHPGTGHFGHVDPDLLVDYNYAANDHLYHPGNYFAHNPSGAEFNTHNLIHHNQLALGDLQHHYGAPHLIHSLKRIDGNVVDKNKLITKLKNIKKVSAKDVVKKVSEMLKNKGQKQNVISKVKIVKTVQN